MKGRYPRIFEHPERGKEAKKLYNDANTLLDKIEKEKLLKAKGVFGLFRANSIEDDIEVYNENSETLGIFHTLRQQSH